MAGLAAPTIAVDPATVFLLKRDIMNENDVFEWTSKGLVVWEFSRRSCVLGAPAVAGSTADSQTVRAAPLRRWDGAAKGCDRRCPAQNCGPWRPTGGRAEERARPDGAAASLFPRLHRPSPIKFCIYARPGTVHANSPRRKGNKTPANRRFSS